MSNPLKIAIVGDFNFAYSSHHATNKALQHVEDFLEITLNYYWINSKEISSASDEELQDYDGFFIAPGPYAQPFYLSSFLRKLIRSGKPALLTGESFKILVQYFIDTYKLDVISARLISENLVQENQFEKVTLIPKAEPFISFYKNFRNIELTSSRYIVIDAVLDVMKENGFIIAAVNQKDEVEIIYKKDHPFFVATMHCPQISSQQDLPHPLITNFVKTIIEEAQ